MGRNETGQKASREERGAGNKGGWRKNFTVNVILLITGCVTAASGLILQIHYHVLKSSGQSTVLLLNRAEWNVVHVWVSAVFSAAVVCHVWAHRRWYGSVLRKNPLPKYRPAVLLIILTVVVIFTGFTPWLIGLWCGDPELRSLLVEIHDKTAILFFCCCFRPCGQTTGMVFEDFAK